MKITERHLRQIIREELICERREATISDIVNPHTKQLVHGWVDKLIDALGDQRFPKIHDMKETDRIRATEKIVASVMLALGDAFATGSGSVPFLKTRPRDPLPKYGRPG
jgi:hypothetical protein